MRKILFAVFLFPFSLFLMSSLTIADCIQELYVDDELIDMTEQPNHSTLWFRLLGDEKCEGTINFELWSDEHEHPEWFAYFDPPPGFGYIIPGVLTPLPIKYTGPWGASEELNGIVEICIRVRHEATGHYKDVCLHLNFGSYVPPPVPKPLVKVSQVKVIDPDGNVIAVVGEGEEKIIELKEGIKFEPLDSSDQGKPIIKFPDPYGDIIHGNVGVTVESFSINQGEYKIAYNTEPKDKDGYEIYSIATDQHGEPKVNVDAYKEMHTNTDLRISADDVEKTVKLIKYGSWAAWAIAYVAYPPAVPVIIGVKNAATVGSLAFLIGKMGESAPENPPYPTGMDCTHVTNNGHTIIHESQGLLELTGDQTTIFVIDGEFELSDGEIKTVTVPGGYTSTCEIGGVPSDPEPFNPDSIDRWWDIEGQIQVHDWDFEGDEAPDWKDDGSGRWFISNGTYTMIGDQTDVIQYSLHDQEYCDFVVQADVLKAGGDGGSYFYGYGLYLRSDGTWRNNYEFNIVKDGRYMIGKSVDGDFTKLVDWTFSDALKTGYKQCNTLKVIAEGSTLMFYANGTHLTTVEDTTFSCGKIGVFAINAASSTKPDIVQFDNVSLVSLQIPDTYDGGYYVTSDLWIRAVINTEEKGPVNAIWQKGGEDTTSAGDRVIWGHFYASPSDVTWGSQDNPDLFVKIWFDHGGRVDVNFFHVSVPDIEVYSDYPYDGTADEQGTTTMDRRYIRQYYENNQSYSSEQEEDGYPPSGYSPSGNPSGYSTINDLRIGSIINTVEKGPIDAMWRLGGQDTTSRGDQVVWGHFYANPNDVTWGSSNNPDLFMKIWFDVSGRVDVNFFHVSVPDIEGYSDLPSEGAYDQKGTTIMDNRYIRHEY